MLADLITFAAFMVVSWAGFSLLRRLLLGSSRPKSGLGIGLTAPLPKSSAAAGLQQDLWRAGYYHASARRNFLLLRVLLLLVCVAASGMIIFAVGADNDQATARIAIATAVVASFAYAIPRFHLSVQARQRVARIQQDLPDALDMITMCVTGGLSLEAALERVAQQFDSTHPDLAVELCFVHRQAKLGTLGQALRQFASRIDAPDVKSLTSVVSHAERLGTDVAAALYGYADGIRRRHRQRAEERANKTGIRMLFPLVLCLAPSVFLLLWGPALLQMRDFFTVERGDGGVLSQSLPASFEFGELVEEQTPLMILSAATTERQTPAN